MQDRQQEPSQAPDPRLVAAFEQALVNLEAARSFGKVIHQNRVLAQAQKLLQSGAGVAQLYAAAPRFAAAGLFAGGDWADPDKLQTALVRGTLQGGGPNATAEMLSELRLLAIATGALTDPRLDAGAARAYLEQVLANNLDMLVPAATEAAREQGGVVAGRVRRLFEFIIDVLGAGGILGALLFEVERVLLQRPIMTQRVESLLRAARRALDEVGEDDQTVAQARYFIAALYGPSERAGGVAPDDYAALLAGLDGEALAQEARQFGASMRRTGLVAPQHASLLRHLVDQAPELLAEALGLDRVGQVSLLEFPELIADIIRFAVTPQTARCIYGLSRMLAGGILFFPPVPPVFSRLMLLPVHPRVGALLTSASGYARPPSPNVLLLAGVISVLGQPRGVDQGHNPTCQAGRAISMWAQNDIGFLLEAVAHAARDDELVMHFEGEALNSGALAFGLATQLHTELDAVSLVLTPHLDRLYMEMSRRTIHRPGDGHRWVNPEFHGWWVYRGFAELMDGKGAVRGCDDFIRGFYAAYHPVYNGGRSLVYVQPCGIAVTNHEASFVGWHAIAIQRVGLDPSGAWRVYFLNPNRDKGQNWGLGVRTSTNDCGECEGESSLPFEQFASRLYVYHYEEREHGDTAATNLPSVRRRRPDHRRDRGSRGDQEDT
ncbi:hypothetical protein [Spectribacter hydrogenoxidans]|uniref:Uncharacterized protein n=1 Tax=Spectribacter hydrogenoxidans TaxID=3075608 RepID=A0ABU3C3Y0_9GAMM|nr:hypothetical protein [Salinisphaera sp. W335]MDT0636271.1 hypothetical protein [Salinisphaera sp. W335]